MIHLPVPIASPTSGQSNDGIVVGSVAQSPLVGAFSNGLLSSNVYAFRMDKDAGTFTNISMLAVSGTTNAVQPFGTTGQMTSGDALILACDSDISEVYIRVDTAGVGSWTGLVIKDSTDGKTFNRSLTEHTDSSNGLKSTGWVKITIPVPSTRSSFSPAPTLSNGIETERKYILIELGTFVSATTAPSIGDIFLRHHDAAVVWTNFTTNANGALTDGTFTGAPATVFYPEGSIRYHVRRHDSAI